MRDADRKGGGVDAQVGKKFERLSVRLLFRKYCNISKQTPACLAQQLSFPTV